MAGESVEVYKAPITDTGKTSKRGRLTLQRTDNGCCGDSSSSSTWTTVQHGQGDPKKVYFDYPENNTDPIIQSVSLCYFNKIINI